MLFHIRPNVSFRFNAALSWLRMEAQLNRKISVNRTTVNYDEQKKLYLEWLAGMHPNIPVVLNPDESVHVYREKDLHSAVASDSDERLSIFNENGWLIVNPRELWHREYFPSHDKHINDEVEFGEKIMKTIEVLSCPAWEASNQRVITNGSACITVPAGWAQMLINNGAQYTNFSNNDDMLFAVNVIWTLGALDEEEANKRTQKLVDEANVKL